MKIYRENIIKTGTIVSIIYPSNIYPSHAIAARELKAKKWVNYESNVKKGEIGIIVNSGNSGAYVEHLYLVDMGDKEIIIGRKGIKEIKQPDWNSKENKCAV